MTSPAERARTLIETRQFLQALIQGAIEPGVWP